MECSAEWHFFSSMDYENEVAAQTSQRNLIVFQPFVRTGEFLCLRAVQNVIHLTAAPHLKHVLLIAPTEYMVKHISQFLKRHLCTSSILSWLGSSHFSTLAESSDLPFGSIAEHLWSKIIISSSSALSSLFSHGLHESQLALIVIYDSFSLMNDCEFNKILKRVDDLKGQTKILWLMSSLFSNCQSTENIIPASLDLQKLCFSSLATVADENALSRIMPVTNDSVSYFKHSEVMGKPCKDVFCELSDVVESCHGVELEFSENCNEILCKTFISHHSVPDILNNIKHDAEELGEYAGSLGTLVALRNLIYLNTFTDGSVSQTTKHFLNYVICCVSKYRKILEEDMFRVQQCERIKRFSSHKVQLLLSLLQKLEENQRALIIVKEAHSACILSTVLQNVAKYDKNCIHIKSELILNGSGIPLSDSWYDVLSWRRNLEIYARFVALKTNVIVLSGDLQGLDLPECDLVVVMDLVPEFSEFISLKRHTKSGCGKFILFCDESYISQYDQQIAFYQSMEKKMRELLVGSLEGKPDTEYMDDQSSECNEPISFTTRNGKVLNLNTATAVLNKFCSDLPSEMFFHHELLWQKKCQKEFSITLHLPRVLPNNIFHADSSSSFLTAEKMAAFHACKELYLRKELDDDLSFQSKPLESGEESTLTEDKRNAPEILCNINYPCSLTKAQPLPGGTCFVHEIRMCPITEAPPPGDNRKTAKYDLLCNRSCFAIVSSKPLPKVCSFPVFIEGHELQVELNTIQRDLVLNNKEYAYLRRFHCGIFLHVVPLVPLFAQFDLFNRENSFFVAPLTSAGCIDWDTVQNHPSIPSVRTLTPEERADLECNRETHERKIVLPWYRSLPPNEIYLVASVCEDMSADSCFPSDDFETFAEYFRIKYDIEDIMRPELPMLEVCLINTQCNGLLPKSNSRKLRREEKMEDFREHMVPELCNLLQFPSSLWLKLAILPSVLHRFARLLLMDDIRRQIFLETDVGELERDWPVFSSNHFSFVEETSPSFIPPSTVKRGLVIGNVKLEERKRQARLKNPWGLNQEPVDIHRNLESLNELEIYYFKEFILKGHSNSHLTVDEGVMEAFEHEENFHNVKTAENFIDENMKHINLLNTNRVGSGPLLHELLQAFTSASSSDVVNMDGIRLLGNTFVNFIVSVYLFLTNPNAMHFKLYQLQNEFLRREKLAQCGKQKNLCGSIKVLEFTPGDWTPPSFTTPHMLKEVIIGQNINSSVLSKITLSEAEQISGYLSDETQDEILDIFTDYVGRGISEQHEAFVGRQYVTVETAANCVEAVIGVYFKSCGWDAALKIIDWLGLFPSGNIQELFISESPPLSSYVSSTLLHRLASLENLLGYDFLSKELLLQAVTHSSCINLSISGCMDRLVFLGRAVLDILITTLIHEKCNKLTPFRLGCLRDALLCPSTLAALAVRHELHKYLYLNSSSLLNAIDRFVRYQEENKHEIYDKIRLLIEEHECDNVYRVELPSVLSNLLPSLIGALYLDAGKNLLLVWKVIQIIFVPQINAWKDNVPLSVVELLMDLSPAKHQVIFSNPTSTNNNAVEISCTLLVDNTREEVFRAIAPDESKAKTLAAKLALRALLGSPEATIEL